MLAAYPYSWAIRFFILKVIEQHLQYQGVPFLVESQLKPPYRLENAKLEISTNLLKKHSSN